MNIQPIKYKHSLQAERRRNRFITDYQIITKRILQELLQYSHDDNVDHASEVRRMLLDELWLCCYLFLEDFGLEESLKCLI